MTILVFHSAYWKFRKELNATFNNPQTKSKPSVTYIRHHSKFDLQIPDFEGSDFESPLYFEQRTRSNCTIMSVIQISPLFGFYGLCNLVSSLQTHFIFSSLPTILFQNDSFDCTAKRTEHREWQRSEQREWQRTFSDMGNKRHL